MSPAFIKRCPPKACAQNKTSALATSLWLVAIAAAIGVAGSAQAQNRPIPDNAKRGVIAHVQAMLVDLDGKTQPLAAGAQIRNRDNLIIVPTAMPRGGVPADYVLDLNGQISRVWLLTEEEVRRPKKQPGAN